MTPAKRNLAIYRGDDYAHELTFTDDADPPGSLDVSSYVFLAQIRKGTSHSSGLLATFNVDMSRAGTGVIVLSLDEDVTATLNESGMWDLQVTLPSGSVQTWLAGRVVLTADVSRAEV